MIRRVTIRVRGRRVYDSDDPLAAARGIRNGLMILLPIWLAVIWLWLR